MRKNRVRYGVIAIVALAAAYGFYSLSSKTDLLGVTPGMQKSKFQTLAKDRGWGCKELAVTHEFRCQTPRGELSVDYTREDSPVITAAVLQILNVSDSSQSLADNISGQYKRKPVKVEGRDPMVTYTWDLGGDISLKMWKAYDLVDIFIRNEKLVADREKAEKSIPKL